MTTAAAQAIRNHKTGAPCCYMPGTADYRIYHKTMLSIKRGDLRVG